MLETASNLYRDPEGAMATLSEMEQRLRELQDAIKETEKRLPAHSVKPPVMMDLLALEDEYDDLLEKIRALKAGGAHSEPEPD
jgi:hypothetical protein